MEWYIFVASHFRYEVSKIFICSFHDLPFGYGDQVPE